MAQDSAPADAIRLYVLDTGLIDCADYAIFSPTAGPGLRKAMSVLSYLVVHPRGMLLWDTGIDDAIAGLADGRRIIDAITFRVPRTLAGQLAGIGVDPAAVPLVGLSHLHIDHVGNLGLFPAATVLVQEAEVDAAFGPAAEELTYIPQAYAALDRSRIRPVAGEHDVFGDGSVVMTPMPGHTPGHQGLLVTLARSGPILLAGDVSYSARDYAEGVPRQSDVDVEATRRSIAAAKALERERGATVWLHHDLEAQRDVRRAPEFYE